MKFARNIIAVEDKLSKNETPPHSKIRFSTVRSMDMGRLAMDRREYFLACRWWLLCGTEIITCHCCL